jgi:hypothetical protein
LPKKKGGLGVINLTIQNDALLLKQLDKFYKKENVQWVNLIWQKYYLSSVLHLAREKGSFWWKDILRLHIHYRGIAVCSPVIGDTVGFWEDLINGQLHADLFPNLLAFAKDSCVSLSKLKNAENLLDFFRLPMSRQAYNGFLELQHYLAKLLSTVGMRRILGPSFGVSRNTPLPSTTISSSVPFNQIELLCGFGKLNVCQKSNSLLGY